VHEPVKPENQFIVGPEIDIPLNYLFPDVVFAGEEQRGYMTVTHVDEVNKTITYEITERTRKT
jgi:hypothetical protein